MKLVFKMTNIYFIVLIAKIYLFNLLTKVETQNPANVSLKSNFKVIKIHIVYFNYFNYRLMTVLLTKAVEVLLTEFYF